MKKKKFEMPHTFVIIFCVVIFAAVLTLFIPLGKYDTKQISYMQDGVEKTREVIDPDSFEYVVDDNGNYVTNAAPLFGTEDTGRQGILNYVFEGMTTGDIRFSSRNCCFYSGCRWCIWYRIKNRCSRCRHLTSY